MVSSDNKQSIVKPVIVGLISLILVGGAYLLGYSVGHKNLAFEKGYKPYIANKELKKPTSIDFSLFWEVWDRVEDKYVGKVDPQKMVYGAINGALSSLDDPYTLFLDPADAKRFDEDLQGAFDGIGAEIAKREGVISVVAPIEDSPAAKAGIKAQDAIIKIDDEETTNMTVVQAVNKIRGIKGTSVKLTIIREGEDEPLEISVTRDTIVLKSVKWEMKENNIGYIRLSLFGDDTQDLLEQAIKELQAKKPKGVIVDVRNNPGGLLDGAIDATSLFTNERGPIVKVVNKAGERIEYKATARPLLTDIPMIVLINDGSASASEILGGALQDYGRARLVGEKTFGKGSVQDYESLKGGAKLRVTTAEWLTPKDRHINKAGIEPDIKVELTADDVKNNRDPQLDRALKELQ